MPPFNPMWITAGLQAADLGLSASMPGGMSDTQLSDQRFMNDFAWKQSLRNESFSREQYEFMKYLAENGMQVRARDAAAAGFHPLAALGGAGMSLSGMGPSSAAFVGPGEGSRRRWPGGHLSAMGQDISRAMNAEMTALERASQNAALAERMANIDYIEAMAAESRQRRLNLANTPMPGGAMTGDVIQLPQSIMYRRADGSYEEGYSPEYSESLQNRPASKWMRDIQHMIRNTGARFGNIQPRKRR